MPPGEVAAVESREEVELAPLPAIVDRTRGSQVQDRRAVLAEAGALVGGGHEPGPPDAGPTGRLTVVVQQHDEARQVVAGRAESVGDPGAEAGPAGEDAAGVHLADAADVVQPVGPARADDAELVGVAADVGVPVRNRQPTVSVALPPASRRQQGVFRDSHRRDHPFDRFGQRLARQPVDLGLGIERVDVAGPAVHEQEDHAAGDAAVVPAAGEHRFGRAALGRQHRGQRQPAESGTGSEQEVAAGGRGLVVRAAATRLRGVSGGHGDQST